MATKTVLICDRDGQPAVVTMTVDLRKAVEGDDDVTETAKVDLCLRCLAKALDSVLPLVPMDVRPEWYQTFRNGR